MNWSDVFGMIISVTSVLITIMTVIVAWHLSRNYLQSVKEMQEIRLSSEELSRQVNGLTDTNTYLLREAMLAVQAMFDMMMTMERRNSYQQRQNTLLTRQEWKGKPVSKDECEAYRGRIEVEVMKIQKEILARQTELYWLVGQSTERAAHLHALATTNGDTRTIELLEHVRQSKKVPEERDDLLVAIAMIRQRLGRPGRSRSRQYASRPWTGRE